MIFGDDRELLLLALNHSFLGGSVVLLFFGHVRVGPVSCWYRLFGPWPALSGGLDGAGSLLGEGEGFFPVIFLLEG